MNWKRFLSSPPDLLNDEWFERFERALHDGSFTQKHAYELLHTARYLRLEVAATRAVLKVLAADGRAEEENIADLGQRACISEWVEARIRRVARDLQTLWSGDKALSRSAASALKQAPWDLLGMLWPHLLAAKIREASLRAPEAFVLLTKEELSGFHFPGEPGKDGGAP
ncbi:MAG TPA: hypothetical protein VGI39_17905 [Polyangiaceae bacterium]|jgi:hypothetical protein